jgi:MFS family permease
VILTLGFVAQFSNSLAFQSIAPLAPLFQPELGLTKAEVGLFSSILFAGQWLLLLPAGSMTDRFGVRKMMSVGQVVIGLCLVSMAWVDSFAQALVVMFIAGVGSCGVLPAVTKAIMDWFSPRVRGTVMGFKQAAVPAGGVITAALLPAVGLAFGWRYAIAVVGLVGIVGGIATSVLYKEGARPAKAAGPGPSIRAGLGAVLRNARLWRLSLVSVLYVSVQLALTTYLALFLKETVLVPAIPDESTRVVVAGGYLAVCQFGGALGRVFWGAVSDRMFNGRRMGVLAFTGVLTVGCSLAVSAMGPGFPLWLIPPLVFVYGASAVGWNGLYHVAMAETAGQKYAATGVGMSMTLNQFGTFFGPPIFGFVVDTTGTYRMAWLLMSGFAFVGLVMAVLNARREGQSAQDS